MNEFVTVLSAELMRRLQSRAFKIGLVLGIVVIALVIKAPQLLGGALSHASDSIVLGGPADLTTPASRLLRKDFEIEGATRQTSTPTLAFLDAHKKAGALVVLAHRGRGMSVRVFARNLSFVHRERLKSDLAPLNLALATSLRAHDIERFSNVPIAVRGIESKFSSEQASDAAQGVAYTLLIFLYISILLNSQLLMTSVAEEKTSRIAELLIASVNPSALLAGKIGAAAILAIIQLASWVVVGYFLGAHGGGAAPHASTRSADMGAMLSGSISTTDILAFGAFFVIGFLQLSTLFAAFASLINRTEDLGSVSGPLIMPVVGAFFIAMYALGFPNAPFVVATSFIPIVAPFTMFARIAISNVPPWQIALSLAINIVAVWLIAIAAGKIYRAGMMLYGRTPKLSQIWTTLRAPS